MPNSEYKLLPNTGQRSILNSTGHHTIEVMKAKSLPNPEIEIQSLPRSIESLYSIQAQKEGLMQKHQISILNSTPVKS